MTDFAVVLGIQPWYFGYHDKKIFRQTVYQNNFLIRILHEHANDVEEELKVVREMINIHKDTQAMINAISDLKGPDALTDRAATADDRG